MSTPPRDPAAIRLGPYTLVGKLGAGGMGEVHLAHDTRLEREVALKLLPAELRADPDRRTRFLREARAIAKLNHPNITQIFDVGEADGRDYLAFELVEGKTLQERIAESPLTLTELVDLALPLADAIAYAHERGVVHRDLKTANVMVTPRGHAKLLDFGLAKVLHEESPAPEKQQSSTLTVEGAIFGTPGAMSPEQALGKPTDARSDVFSFGSLLYEMAAGRPAFHGATVMEVIDAVIHREPDPLERLRADLPPEFIACVRKAMRKERTERYQTMNDLAADLRHWKRTTDSGLVPPGEKRGRHRTVFAAFAVLALGALGWVGWRLSPASGNASTTSPERRSLAVLPFTNLGASSEDASFAIGLHSDVVTRLAKIGSLKVIARTSVLEYAATMKALRQIGQELSVGAILSGEVLRAGNALRLNLTLHDATSEDSLWAESYDREVSSKDLFAVQSDIAEAVAHALQAHLSPADKRQLRSVPTTNDKAYDAYLTALSLRDKYESRWAPVIELLESSVALDPRFALAWASLSEARSSRYWGSGYGARKDKDLLASAFEAARRALEIEPDLPEGHLRLGACHYVSRDYEAAEREYAIAELGLPNSAEVLLARANMYRRTGRWNESLEAGQRAVELSPREGSTHWNLSITLHFLGHYDESLRQIDLAAVLADGERTYYYWIVTTHRDGRVPPAAFADSVKGDRVDAEDVVLRWRLRLLARDPAGALADLESAPELLAYQWHVYPRALLAAIAQELAGDADGARQQYEAARKAMVTEIEAHPDDARLHAASGLALAGLNRRDEALAEAARATEMLPMERDAIVGGGLLLDRFHAELRLGALDEAVRSLDAYLARPGLFTLRVLVLDPRLDVLAGHPGFEELRKRRASH